MMRVFLKASCFVIKTIFNNDLGPHDTGISNIIKYNNQNVHLYQFIEYHGDVNIAG